MSIDVAIGYATKYGFSVVPQQIKGERKGLVKFKGRDLREAAEITEVFGSVGPCNVAAKAGEESGGLTEVDIDQRECLDWAASFLPPTTWNWGRAGNPGSHWAYRCEGQPQLELKNPLADGEKPTIVEVRGGRNKLITLPPAVHGGSGEAVEFVGRPDAAGPPTVGPDVLVRQCKLLAAAWLLWKYGPSDGAHDYAFAWGGASRTSGLTDLEAEQVARCFLTRFETSRFEDHVSTVRDGRSTEQSKRLVGWTSLANMWAVNRAERARLLKKLREWLDERKAEDLTAQPRMVVTNEGRYFLGPADKEHYIDSCTQHTLQSTLVSCYQGAYDSIGDFNLGRIRQAAKPVAYVKYSYVVPETTYEAESKTLTVGVAVDAKLVPGYSSDVQHWLDTLAGSRDQAKRLTEWLAATRPDRLMSACPALCIIGAPGVGKSVLAHAVSRCWGLSEALPGNLLVSRFNGSLQRCPVVLCDEELPKGLDGNMFRTRVTSTIQTVEKKGQERTTIDGCLRLVLAANSDAILNLGPHGLEDAEAISARILRIDVPRERTQACVRAADPIRLAEGSDRLDTAKIAEHIMWLWENIPLTTRSDRWIVSPCSNALQTVLEGHAGAHEELWDHIEAELRKQTEPAGPGFAAGMANGGVYLRPEGVVIVPAEIAEHLTGAQAKELRNAVRPFTKDKRFDFKLDGRHVHGWLLDTKLLPGSVAGLVRKTGEVRDQIETAD